MASLSFAADKGLVQFKSGGATNQCRSQDCNNDESSTVSATSRSSFSSVTISQCFAYSHDELQVGSDDEASVQSSCSTSSAPKSWTPMHRSLPMPQARPQAMKRSRSCAQLHSVEPVTLAMLETHLHQLTRSFGKDHPLVARTWHLIGNAHYRRECYREALAAYKEAVLCGDVGIHLAEAYFDLGRTYSALGDVQEAVDYFKQSLHTHEFFAVLLDRDLGASRIVGEIHLQLGLALQHQGQIDGARTALQEACRIFGSIPYDKVSTQARVALNDLESESAIKEVDCNLLTSVLRPMRWPLWRSKQSQT